MASEIKILVHSENEVLQEVTLIEGQTSALQAQDNVTYELRNLDTDAAPEELVAKRNGDNLELYTAPDAAAPIATIEGYFLLASPSPLVGMAESGDFYPFVPQSGEAAQLPWNLEDGDSSHQSLGYDTQGSAVPWWPILLAGLLLIGGAVAASSSSSSGGGGAKPAAKPDKPTVDEITNNYDKDGDLTDTVITGEAKPGDKVIITDDNGDIVGEGTTDDNGGFEVTVPGGLEDGKDYDVVVDKDGNKSDPETITGDTTAPDKPVIDETTNNPDGSTTIKGEAEAGSKVEITDENGNVIGEGTADEDGKFEITVPDGLEDGKDYDITAKDEHNNTSDPETVTGDTTPPSIDNIESKQLDTSNPADGEPNQTQVIFESDDPNAEFIVTGPNGETPQDIQLAADGKWVATFEPPLTPGGEFTITGTDAFGNTASATDTVTGNIEYVGGDNEGPEITDVIVEQWDTDNPADGNADETRVTFKADDPNATYTVTGPNDEAATVTDNGDGTYSAVFQPALNAGDEVTVRGEDPAGNDTEVTKTVPSDMQFEDTEGPEITDVTVEQWDTNNPADGNADETRVTFTANDPTATYTVTGPNGEIATVTNNGDGTYSAVFAPALTAGDEVIVKGIDLAGNEAEETGTVPADISFDDEDAPAIPIIETGDITNHYDADNKLTGTTVKGKVEDQDGNPEQGATVEITDENGNVIGAGTTDNDGNFEVIIEPALNEGETYEVVAKDKAGNESDPETITGDTTAPAQPSAILIGDAPHDDWITQDEINVDGTIKVVVKLPATGVEAGDILVVNGIEQTITQADIDSGQIELELDAPNEGEALTVDAYIKDDYNNPSNTVSESATVDTLAPEKPIIDSIDANGDVTGHTEPGATITDKDGNPLLDDNGDEIKADSDGKFDIPAASRPGPPAEDIIKAQDPAGNLSDETNILQPPPIENAIDRVESIENGVIKDHSDPANYDRIANNGFTNDAQPLFEIPASMAGSVNENILIINGQIVEAEKVDQGDGKTYLRPKNPLNEAPHDVSYTTDQSVDLTTDPTTLDQDALSDAFTLTVDTTAPSKPIVDETTNNFDANGDTESTTITGKAEPGSKVEITDENGVLVGEGTADNEGDFEITVAPALEDGKDYDVVAKDEAGNTSEPETITGDTTAPDAPESITIGDGDGWINADEASGGKVSVTVKLPSTNVSVGDVLVVNGEKHVITPADLTANEVTLELNVPNEGDSLEVDAYLEDSSGNRSSTINSSATVDTTAPTVDAEQITPNEISVTSDEAGEIKIIGEDGTVIGTGTVLEGGTVAIALDRDVNPNELITIEVTDEAGNTGSDTFNAVRSDTHAVENHEELVLNAVAKEVNMDGLPGSLVGEKAINFGVASAGLGGVADAGVLDFDNLINATVDEGTERKLKLFADGGGISIGQVFDLVVLKEDEYGNWKFYQVYEDWFTIPFLGYRQEESITLNDPGNYAVFLSGKAGVGVLAGAGLEVIGDTVFDYNNPESVSGEISGNVLTDVNNFGSEFGQDIYDKENTTVTKVTFDGVEYDVPSNGILTIDAEHGTLTIDPTGKYTYEVKDGALPAYGTTEKFTYTITNGVTGDSSSADLTIELVQNPSNVLPSANDTLWLDPATEEIPIDDGDKLSSKSWSEIAGVGLGIADVSAVIIENGMDITVGENQVRDISFSGEGGAPVAIGYTPVTFAIYKLEHTEHGDFWQLYTVQEDWWGIVGVVVGAGQSSENINVRLDEGQYKAVLIPNTAGVAVIPTVTLKVESDTLYEHKATNNELSGDVDLSGFELYGVDGVLKGNASDITVQGEYGTLVINSDGSYTYTLKSNFDSKNIGAVDTFSYSMKDPVTGQLKTSTLNITINSVQTEDDFDRAGFGMDNIESYEGWSVDTRTSGSSTKTYAKDINVGENQIFDLTFDYSFSSVGLTSSADQYMIRLIDTDNGTVIETHLDAQGSKGEDGSWQLHLPEGNYRVEVVVDPRLAYQQNVEFNLSGTVTSLDDFRTEADNHDPAEGNLLANDGYEQYGQIEVNGKPLAIITDDKFNNNPVKSITVEGEHGTLTVHQDGSYTYKANGSSYGIDEFDYKLISINGTSESAKLSINVGMNITGSQYDDIITGSDGSDTLRYELLDNEDATGGNGTDTWTDFHIGDVELDVAADQIDLSKLLEGVDTNNASEYLKVEHNAADNTLTLSIDRDGAGSEFDYEALLVLENQTDAIDLEDLLNNQQIIF